MLAQVQVLVLVLVMVMLEMPAVGGKMGLLWSHWRAVVILQLFVRSAHCLSNRIRFQKVGLVDDKSCLQHTVVCEGVSEWCEEEPVPLFRLQEFASAIYQLSITYLFICTRLLPRRRLSARR